MGPSLHKWLQTSFANVLFATASIFNGLRSQRVSISTWALRRWNMLPTSESPEPPWPWPPRRRRGAWCTAQRCSCTSPSRPGTSRCSQKPGRAGLEYHWTSKEAGFRPNNRLSTGSFLNLLSSLGSLLRWVLCDKLNDFNQMLLMSSMRKRLSLAIFFFV